MKKSIIPLLLSPLMAFSQIEPTGSIQGGVNLGTGLHAGIEAGVSINRRFTAAIDYNAYTGAHAENVIGVKIGLATIYKDTDGLCPVYLIAGASKAFYRGSDGKGYSSVAPTYSVRVQNYNVYWEVGRQNGYWSFTIGYQLRNIYD